MHIGKLIGVVGGLFTTMDHLGAIAGFLAGTFFDVFYNHVVKEQKVLDAWQQEFAHHVIALYAKVAKADGRVTPAEIRAFRYCTKVVEEDEASVGAIFNASRTTADGYQQHAQRIADLCAGQERMLRSLMETFFYMAVADGPATAGQRQMVYNTGILFGLTQPEIEKIEKQVGKPDKAHSGTSHAQGSASAAGEKDTSYEAGGAQSHPFKSTAIGDKDPYDVLGVPDTADEAEIKKQYRKLVRKNHPDKLRGEGAGDAAIKKAEDKVAELNAAYDIISGK